MVVEWSINMVETDCLYTHYGSRQAGGAVRIDAKLAGRLSGSMVGRKGSMDE